jgi:hypothetical protein
MKKVLMIVALIVSGTAAVKAQTVTDNKTSNVSIIVSDVRTIAISGGNPVFTLAQPSDYLAAASTSGLAGSLSNTLTVLSRTGYKVKANLGTDFINANPTGNGGTSIPGNFLGITFSNAAVTGNEIMPSSSIQTITSFPAGGGDIANIAATPANAGGTLGTHFDVSYSLYNFPNVINLAMGTYNAQVTYTIEAQ